MHRAVIGILLLLLTWTDLFGQRIPGVGRFVVPRAVSSAFDSSVCRTNTYGTPDFYASATRALNSNGDGSEGDPYNLDQAKGVAGGSVVCFLPIGASTPVDMVSVNSSGAPTFNPTNSGTSGNRTVFVAKYAAIALSNVETNQNRTELRHDGTHTVVTTGTGSAMYGCDADSYVTFDGFYVDSAEAEPRPDSGVVRDEGTGCHYRNFVIKGHPTDIDTNPILWRPHGSVDVVLHNFRAYDYSNTGSQQALFSDQYSDRNYIIEYGEIRNTQRGIFVKGQADGSTNNYGTIRYTIVSDVSSCYAFDFFDATNTTTLHNSLCYDLNGAGAIQGVIFTAQTQPARNFLGHHITVAKYDSASDGGCFKIVAEGITDTASVSFRDNLCDMNATGIEARGWDICAEDGGPCVSNRPSLPGLLNYNRYYANGSTVRWQWHNGTADTTYTTIGDWRTATGKEAQSDVLATAPFVDRANDNYRISDGHAAKTASTSGGEVGAYGETSETIGPYGSYGF